MKKNNVLQYLKPYRASVVMGLTLKFLESILELFIPIMMARLIERCVGRPYSSDALRMGLEIFGVICVCIVLAVWGQYFSARASVGYGRTLRGTLIRRIVRLPAQGGGTDTASLQNRLISDVTAVQNAVNFTVRVGSRVPFMALGSVVMAIILDSRIAVVFAVCVPLVALAMALVLRRTVPLAGEVQRRFDRVAAVTGENLSGLQVVRAYGQEDRERQRFEAASESYRRTSLRVARLSAAMSPVSTVVMQLGIVGVLLIGGSRVHVGEMSPATVTAFITYILQTLLAMTALANLIVLIIRGVAGGSRIQAVLALPPGAAAEGEGTLDVPEGGALDASFAGVSFAYEGADVLHGVTFDIPAGSTLGIIGGTGSGKTTLVSLLPRLLTARTGQVSLGGKDVRLYRTDALRAAVGVVPQRAALFSGTVRENLCLGRAISDEDLERALSAAQCGFLRHKNGLDTVLEQGGANLSGGQRQRLCIARALAGKPRLLILDDSASALDFATDRALFNALSGMEDMTTVIVSQRVSSLRRADRIVVLSGGTVAAVGTHRALLAQCEVYQSINASQSKGETP